MITKKQALVVATAVAIAVIVVAVVLYAQYRIRGHGTIKVVGVGVYTDAGCTIICSEIDWGVLAPGELKKVGLYIKNPGNVPINLTLSTENWTPVTAEAYLSISWNYTGQTLIPGEVTAVDVSMSVSPDITGITDFSQDIVITAEG